MIVASDFVGSCEKRLKVSDDSVTSDFEGSYEKTKFVRFNIFM